MSICPASILPEIAYLTSWNTVLYCCTGKAITERYRAMAKRNTRPTTPAPANDHIVRFNRKGYISQDITVDMVGFYCNLPTCANNESVTYRDNRPNSPGYGNLFNAVTATRVSGKFANTLKHLMSRKGYDVTIIEIGEGKDHVDATEHVNI